MLEHGHIIDELNRNKQIIEHFLVGLSPKVYLWKQTAEKWCLLEITCHLLDEEREDFKARIQHIFQYPNTPFPPIAPERWVTERKYMEQDYEEVVKLFLAERTKSISWLQALQNPAWDNAYEHPHFGRMSAKMLLMNWLAHDFLHIRQILRLKNDYYRHNIQENLSYAGNW